MLSVVERRFPLLPFLESAVEMVRTRLAESTSRRRETARRSPRAVLFALTIAACAAGGPFSADSAEPKTVPAPATVEELAAIEKKVTKLVDTLSAATVAVRIGRAQGSGVIVSKDGDVLTAAHVAGKPNEPATFVLSDGRVVRGITLGLDRATDAGMMRITEKGDWPVAPMADGVAPRLGDWCIALGHPGGYQPKRGAVARLGRVVAAQKALIQTDCTLVGGDSGGPLFDLEGRVIGIHSRIGASTNWNFHVPMEIFRKDWDRFAKSEEIDKGPSRGATTLGVSGDDVENGVRITRVPDGFPARKAGLMAGDVITKFAGDVVKDFTALADLVRKQKPGDEVTIEFLRDGTVRQARATLVARE